ncbi:MAG: quinolinate synthase NadA [Sphingobacteriaceae bacterium]
MLFTNEIEKIGYISRSVPEDIDLKHEIATLKKAKNAIILAHYYVPASIQTIADFVGDSLALAQASKEVKADIIVFCGVHFMAETAKILNPNTIVLIPDLNAGCSLADSVTEADFWAFKQLHPNALVVSYINSSAAIKAMSDYICTSSNAAKIVKALPPHRDIIFAPDKNLGVYVQRITGRKLILWEGACIVHINISLEKLEELMDAHPQAVLIAHPECSSEILTKADFIGSTNALIEYVVQSEHTSFIVATEAGILHKMQEAAPNKTLIPAPSVERNTCACSECPYMKMNTLEKVYNCLQYELPKITIEPAIQIGALKALTNMLSIK